MDVEWSGRPKTQQPSNIHCGKLPVTSYPALPKRSSSFANGESSTAERQKLFPVPLSSRDVDCQRNG